MPLDFDALSTEATPESLKAEMAAHLAEKGLDVDTREGSYTDLLFSEAAYQIYKGLSYHQTLLAAAVPSARATTALTAAVSTPIRMLKERPVSVRESMSRPIQSVPKG